MKNLCAWASLVVQWLKICLPAQWTRVQSLIWEDPKCCVRDNLACVPQVLRPAGLEPMLCNKRSHCDEKPMSYNKERLPLLQLEKALAQQQRPRAAVDKINQYILKKEEITLRFKRCHQQSKKTTDRMEENISPIFLMRHLNRINKGLLLLLLLLSRFSRVRLCATP